MIPLLTVVARKLDWERTISRIDNSQNFQALALLIEDYCFHLRPSFTHSNGTKLFRRLTPPNGDTSASELRLCPEQEPSCDRANKDNDSLSLSLKITPGVDLSMVSYVDLSAVESGWTTTRSSKHLSSLGVQQSMKSQTTISL